MKKIAAIQMSSSDNVDENLSQAEQLISKASSQGALLVVLPEIFAIMGKTPTDKVDVAEEYGNGKIQSFLSRCAKQYNIWIVGGTIPLQCEDKNKVRAACIVYDSTGKSVARYDKIHLFDAKLSETESFQESNTTEPGNSVVVIDSPVGKLGLVVCYDIRFPTLLTELMSRGVEVITIPAAFFVKTGEAHWKLLTRARAVDTFSYIIVSAQSGVHASGRKTYGHTLIVNPWGTVVSEIAEAGNAIAYADIDLKQLREIRKSIPVLQHKKTLYDLTELDDFCR